MTMQQKHRLILNRFSATPTVHTVGFIVDGVEYQQHINLGLSKLANVVEALHCIKAAALSSTEISELGFVLIREVGVEGLRDFVRIEIDGELMAEIRDRVIPFSIPLLQAIDAVNGDNLVSIQAGLDARYEEREFVPPSEEQA